MMKRTTTKDLVAAAVLIGAAASLVSCAAGNAKQIAYTPAELQAEARRRVLNARPGEIVVPYQVSPDLVERAHLLTRYVRSEYETAKVLIDAVTNENQFGVEYEATATAPAEETVARGYGNCLALTSVFIGLARGVGMEAYYIDASDRVNDIRREEAIIVDSGHIAAVTRTERGWTMVDFAGELPNYRTFRIIDDLTALAHYYNNRGYELIDEANREGVAVPWDEVRRSFDIATKVRPDFSLAHNNLGVLNAQADQDEAAERAYLAAIEADDDFAAPYHNLGNLRLSNNDLDGAIEAYDAAISIRKKNPYLHYHRGIALYRRGDLEEAAASFERAIGLKRDYLEPRNVLAQVYDKLGRHEDAAKIRKSVRNLLSQNH
jgi:tetratricopeptide (TPR) repeat protein